MRFPVLLSIVLLACASMANAQAVAPPVVAVPSIGEYQLGVGYSSVTGPTDNGTLFSVAKQFSPRVWLTAKNFMLASPSGVNISVVGPRYRFPLSALRRADGYFDSSKWFLFADLGVGVVKDGVGAVKGAYGPGVGLDYRANDSLTLLVVEADYFRSSYFQSGGILVTNVHTLTSGLKFTF